MMPVGFKIYPEKQFAYFKASGLVTIKEIMTAGVQIFIHPQWRNGYNIIGDYREITSFNPSMRELQDLVHQDKEFNPKFDKSKFAVITHKDIVFGIGRMWEMLSIDNVIDAYIFKDLDKALDWLKMELTDFNKVAGEFVFESV